MDDKAVEELIEGVREEVKIKLGNNEKTNKL